MSESSMTIITSGASGDSQPVRAKKRILLVDDVKLFIELEKTFFQRKEMFEVLTASTGHEALEIVAKEQPDLIYMDLYMPHMNGDECCRRIKESDSGHQIPVIMVTSAGSEEDRGRCLAAGCDEIITKPINRADFLSAAKKYLEVHERKEPRYTAHIRVKYGSHREKVLADYSVNLSAGGVFLEANEVLPIDTLLYLDFNLPESDRTICCKARVAWVNIGINPVKKDLPTGMGLQFVDITLEDIDAIRGFITARQLVPEW